jgi:2-polyprenyl-3-methyl-5-hydroxy-6-metoxy-1,4-benzoquinol methylase
MKKIIKQLLSPIFKSYDVRIERNKQNIDALYKLLYNQINDLDNALPLAAQQTIGAFGFQWAKLREGEAMLSDKWFNENVPEIIADHELLLNKDWFKGKDVIDCGCGGGRWSYGLAKLGANITAVDVNQSAIIATEDELKDINVKKEFIVTPLEELSSHLPAGKKYDLAWSWGVLPFVSSFTQSFQQVMDCVKDGGFIYVNLYGRETLNYEQDIDLFKNRVRYNTLPTWEEKEKFLIEKAGGNKAKVHQNHDMYSPLLNRRFEFSFIKKTLEDNGFTDVVRTVNNTELFVRAVKKAIIPADKHMIGYTPQKEWWFSRYQK